jgi:hypothetical protein
MNFSSDSSDGLAKLKDSMYNSQGRMKKLSRMFHPE